MRRTIIGQQILQLRKQQKILRKDLARGLCSAQALADIEKGISVPDKLLMDILIQRLGKSPDKLEMILSYQTYKMERTRDFYEELLERGQKKKAESLLEGYYAKFRNDNKVQRMYYCRSKAYAAYRLEHDFGAAEEWIREALDTTLEGWQENPLEQYRISTIEMENLLFYARLLWEMQPERQLRAENLLEACWSYIDKNFSDGEEHAKIFGKCAWLLARIYIGKNRAKEALELCEPAFSELRKYGICYFMMPLLDLMKVCAKTLGLQEKYQLYQNFYTALENLHREYMEGWHFSDSIFHNCYQKEYHLDYEIIHGERLAQEYTQEKFIEGIYRAAESLSRVENGREVPNTDKFGKIMEKLNLPKSRYNTLVITDTFENLELKQEIDIAITKKDYARAEELLNVLRGKLDLQKPENARFLQCNEILIQFRQKKLPREEALEGAKAILAETYRAFGKNFYRAPFHAEAIIINLIGLALDDSDNGKKEKINLYENVVRAMDRSKVDVKYRYRPYGLLLCNLAIELRSAELAKEGIMHALKCGKLSILYINLMTVICALLNEKENRSLCQKMMKDTYYLCKLVMNEEDEKITLAYYEKKFGEPLL